MSLEERIDATENNLPVIPVITLLGLYAVGDGLITKEEVLANLKESMSDTLTSTELTDFDVWIKALDGMTTLQEKMEFLFKLFCIMNVADYNHFSKFKSISDIKTPLGFK